DFTASGMVGSFTESPTLGVVFSTLVRPQSNKLTIQLLPTSPLYNNHDPILNAFTLELVPEPSTLLMLGLAGLLVVPAGLRLRRRRI
ncbi:MAG TPA: PEP-CTERM sorting domain-containing protein, partial [Thermoguttaceae bacterium]|nr:PEP-CTERM sorting domain-containing protein [Thermoguttaceae bacterium]